MNKNLVDFKTFFESINHGIIVIQDEKIVYINKHASIGFGTSKKNMVGRSYLDFIPFKQKKILKKKFSDLILDNKTKNIFEVEIINTKREKRNLEFRSSLTIFNGKKAIISSMRDITQEKTIRNELIESEEKYKDLVEKSKIAILIEDNDGNYIYFNESFHKLFGYTVDEIKKTSNSDLIHPDDFKRVMGYHNKRINGKKAPSDYEHRAIKKDGSIIYLSLNVVPIVKDTMIVGTHSYIWDITDRKLTEDALRESEIRFRNMANLLPQGVFEHDLKGKLTYANEQGLKLYGYSSNDLSMGINILNTLIPEERDRGKNNTEIILNGGNPKDHEFTALRKDGSTFPVAIYTSLIYKNDKPFGVRGVIIDNTEYVEAQKRMKSRNEELELLNDMTVGRELKMIELKKEINALLEKSGQKPKYDIIG